MSNIVGHVVGLYEVYEEVLYHERQSCRKRKVSKTNIQKCVEVEVEGSRRKGNRTNPL